MFACLMASSSNCGIKRLIPDSCGNIPQRHSVSQPYNLSAVKKTSRRDGSSFAASDPAFSNHDLAFVLRTYISWTQTLQRAFEHFGRKRWKLQPTEPLGLSLDATDYLLFDQQLEPPTPRERLHETICRLGALFGSGWFFEWPGGKRPLNSTWPWADVKPSLLVLWGVCWMFVIAPTLDRGSPYQAHAPGHNHRNLGGFPPGSSEQYYYTPSATQSPIVKREPLPLNHPQSTLAGNWPLFPVCTTTSPLDEYLYTTSPAPPQPGHLPHFPQQQQLRQAEPPAAPAAMHQNNSHRLATNLAPGYLPSDTDANVNPHARVGTNTSGNNSRGDVRRAAENGGASQVQAGRLRYPLNLVKSDKASGDISGIDFQNIQPHHQQHHQQSQYYDAHRHSKPQYSRATVSPNPPYSSFNNYPNMSLYDQNRTFPNYPTSTMMHEEPEQQDDNGMQHTRYPSPGPQLSDNPYNAQQVMDTPINIDLTELPTKAESDPSSPGRSRAIPKPDREVTKSEDGRFECQWPGCTEEIKTFNRKCEWSKHMDKHDRPYKCPADGCEKLPGFTYSGGLLRHEREVHNLHGGPRKQLNCPHPNCKRHSGKGFSRQENLNEHLRRVHTPGNTENGGDETEDDGSERAGMKRKRGPGRAPDGDIREEMARLRKENEDLRRNAEIQHAETQDLMHQLQNLQAIVGARISQGGAPQALM